MPPKSNQPPATGRSAITGFFKPRSQMQTPTTNSPSSQSEDHTSSQTPSQEPSIPSSPRPAGSSHHSSAAEPAPTQNSASRVSQLASSPSLRSPSPLPPSSPIVKPSAPRPKDAVIEDSNDEDDDFGGSDSSDDMIDIMAKFDRSRDESKAPVDASLFETPTAKRRFKSKNIHASPLTFQLKKRSDQHDFDMKALLEDAEQDKATMASYLQNKQEAAAHAESEAAEAQADKDAVLFDVIAQTGGENAHKVMRTMKRAQPGQGALRYCFFGRTPRATPSVAMPSKKVATGPWRMLIQGSAATREQYLVSGLPYTILLKTGDMPEEVFDWMLQDLCVSQSRSMQMAYAKLVGLCPAYVHRRVTPRYLEELFRLLGADENLDLQDNGALSLVRPTEDPYQGEDWSNLRAFLMLLGELAEAMAVESVSYAAQILLKMSMDKFIFTSMNILMEYEKTVSALLSALPTVAWGNFCAEASQYLHGAFKSQCVRIYCLMCLPVRSERAHELRRRLATAFLLDDPSLGGHHPDTVITVRRIIESLRSETFDITPETDYEELRAAAFMLDIALDDGSWVATTEPDEEKQFNADIDELATTLRALNRRVNDSNGQAARSNFKGVIEWVEFRALYNVRTRPKPKISIFDTVKKEDVNLPQQQNYMRNFLGQPLGNPWATKPHRVQGDRKSHSSSESRPA